VNNIYITLGLGDELSEGNCNEGGWNLVGNDGSEVKKDTSFAWRGGQERQTTGIWMWSEPFIRRSQSFGKHIMLLLRMKEKDSVREASLLILSIIYPQVQRSSRCC